MKLTNQEIENLVQACVLLNECRMKNDLGFKVATIEALLTPHVSALGKQKQQLAKAHTVSAPGEWDDEEALLNEWQELMAIEVEVPELPRIKKDLLEHIEVQNKARVFLAPVLDE